MLRAFSFSRDAPGRGAGCQPASAWQAGSLPHGPALRWRVAAKTWKSWLAASLLAAHLDVVEVGLGVGLAPQPDLARVLDGVVLGVQVLLAVEITLDVIARHFDLQRVPFAGGYLEAFLGFQLRALAGHHLVDAEVVLQRVHAGDVVV